MAIVAAFKPGQTRIFTKSAHQYDRGQQLIVTGIALPESFEMHISNDKDGGMATSYRVSAAGMTIPDAYFATGKYVYIWIYFIEISENGYYYALPENGTLVEEPDGSSRNEGTTVYEIVIPVIPRAIQLPTLSIEYKDVAGYEVDEDHTLIPVKI